CVNVYNFLRKGNCSDDICYAGLLHSIYGNDIFDVDFKIERKTIKDLIGEEAESIVYHFNNTSRDKLWKEKNSNILPILVANELDNKFLFEIIENVFDDFTVDKLYAHYRDFRSWNFTGAGLNSNHRKLNIELKKSNKIDKILFNKADEIIEQNNLKQFITLKRAYASGYTHGTIHDLHCDDGAQSFNEIYTVMFYLNKEWNVNFAGETVFYYSQTETIDSILPRPSRAILFDGAIPHLARDPSRLCPELRMVATFKYQVGNT
ncbi:DUF6817 domain-containing protein, partial [Hyphomonas sp.]|uniref:DUF6817 domain-containing protein n=1 Tax=Hyphomonas sp. TaxID=87 RepID=UPI000C97F08F|nr:hypothetical protein [Hyphomonas sp.]